MKFKLSILIWGHNSVLLLLFQTFVLLFLTDIKELVLNVLPIMYIHKNRIYLIVCYKVLVQLLQVWSWKTHYKNRIINPLNEKLFSYIKHRLLRC